MRKIPTLFLRDPVDRRRLLDEVHPDCQWVLDGEGVALRKYDGTCTRLDVNGAWWARREIKPGRGRPPGFKAIGHEPDAHSGKLIGWEPIANSAFARYHAEALARDQQFAPGTHELCGPKINANPEHYPEHRLIRHDDAEDLFLAGALDFERLRVVVNDMYANCGWEGLVWVHRDGRRAKLKARDFRGTR